MERFGSVADALDFAIAEEQGAWELYTRLAGEARSSDMRQVFEQFAQEECGHKIKLEGVKAGRTMVEAQSRVTALAVMDYRVVREDTPVNNYQGALLLAMAKEKAAYRMYNDLAAASSTPVLRELFLGLAHEEANHKLRFELEYDAFIAPEN